jgi:hypothetical protein
MTSVGKELEARGHGGTEARDLGHEVREAVVEAFVRTFGFSGAETVELATSVER